LIYSEGKKGLVEGAVGVFRTYDGLKLFVGFCDSFLRCLVNGILKAGGIKKSGV